MAQRVSSPVLVGRAAEVAQLHAALDRARSGTPATVVVAGEAGVGKTRLLGELLDHADGHGVLTLTGGCLDLGDGVVAYAPIVEALRSLVGRLEPDALDGVLGHARGELARLIPELGGPVEPASTVPPGRLFELLLGVLHRLAETSPVLLVVEDAHWADESTRHLLGFLVRNLRSGVLLVCTYRSDELHRRHPLRPFLAELERSGRAERLDLGRLDRTELAKLLGGILGEQPTPGLVTEILARSEGNPFFAEELVAARVEGVALPDALRDLLLARVESLPKETQRVLQVAAVAGRQVDHDLLAEVAGLPPEQLVELLREAIVHHVLVVQDGGGAGYAFRHALVQEAIYDDLLPMQRVPLHAACARALSSGNGPPNGRAPAATLGQLARHWHTAHNLGEALVASVRAGQAAEAATALPEAQHHYQRALELWEQAPEATARSPLDRTTLLRRAAQAMALTGDAGRAVTLIGEALVWLGRWDAADRLLDQAFDIDSEVAGYAGAVVSARARLRLWRGDLAGARADIDAALASPGNALDAQFASPTLALLAMVATRLEEGRATAARALALLEGTDDARYVIEPSLAGLEAEAAIAERAAARRDARAVEEAAGVVADLLRQAHTAAAAGNARLSRMAQAMLLTAEAHQLRVTGRSDPDRWAAAATAWDGLAYRL